SPTPDFPAFFTASPARCPLNDFANPLLHHAHNFSNVAALVPGGVQNHSSVFPVGQINKQIRPALTFQDHKPMNQVLWIIIACGALSIVYGALTTRSLLAASPGNARMQEIAAAIQEGAQAYLARQYTTIAIV